MEASRPQKLLLLQKASVTDREMNNKRRKRVNNNERTKAHQSSSQCEGENADNGKNMK
jgi:hypothetical protein